MISWLLRRLRERLAQQPRTRRLGECAVCLTGVYEDDENVRLHGMWFHRDCAEYRRADPRRR